MRLPEAAQSRLTLRSPHYWSSREGRRLWFSFFSPLLLLPGLLWAGTNNHTATLLTKLLAGNLSGHKIILFAQLSTHRGLVNQKRIAQCIIQKKGIFKNFNDWNKDLNTIKRVSYISQNGMRNLSICMNKSSSGNVNVVSGHLANEYSGILGMLQIPKRYVIW